MITIYSKNNCPDCQTAKRVLDMYRVGYCDINIDTDDQAREFLLSQGHRSVPQFYVNNELLVENGLQGLLKLGRDGIIRSQQEAA